MKKSLTSKTVYVPNPNVKVTVTNKPVFDEELGRLLSYNAKQHQQRLGIDLSAFKIKNKRLLLRNCVEPEVGLHILNEALR